MGKRSVEVGKPQEDLEVAVACGNLTLGNSQDMIRLYFDAVRGDEKPNKPNSICINLAS
jgi:hypothetical protein